MTAILPALLVQLEAWQPDLRRVQGWLAGPKLEHLSALTMLRRLRYKRRPGLPAATPGLQHLSALASLEVGGSFHLAILLKCICPRQTWPAAVQCSYNWLLLFTLHRCGRVCPGGLLNCPQQPGW
jgi:hypothetical protein